MRKWMLVVACVLGLSLFALGQGNVLRLLTWEGYITPELIAKFQDETGIRVEYTYVADNGEIIAMLRASPSAADLAQPDLDNMLESQQWNLYQPIDYSRIPNVANIDPVFIEAVRNTPGAFSEGQFFWVPFNWGTSGIIYRTDAVTEEVDSYGVLFDPQYAGKITYRTAFPTLVSTGLYLGYDMRRVLITGDVDLARRVFQAIADFLIEKKPLVKDYWNGIQQRHIQLMTTGGCVVSQGWDGTAWALMEMGVPVRYVDPKEGSLGWMGGFAIPTGSRNVEGAYLWINFILDPENYAMVLEGGGYSPVVPAALELISEEVRERLEGTHTPEGIANIWWYPPFPPQLSDIVNDALQRIETAP